jgi:hypothetical protein
VTARSGVRAVGHQPIGHGTQSYTPLRLTFEQERKLVRRQFERPLARYGAAKWPSQSLAEQAEARAVEVQRFRPLPRVRYDEANIARGSSSSVLRRGALSVSYALRMSTGSR